MGRTRTAARPAAVARRALDRGALAGRVMAAVLASIALLLSGAVDVLPRGAAGPLAPTGAGAAQAPAPTGTVEAPSTSVGVRAAGLAAVPAPTGPGGGLPPTAGPLVAPHLVADPQSRPPTSALPAHRTGTSGSRAPPGPAGT